MNDRSPDFMSQYPSCYGASYQSRKPDYDLCAGRVSDGGRWPTSHQCAKKNGHGPEGAWCKQHDPAAVKARQAASYSKWEAESANSARNMTFAADCKTAIRDIAAGHNDPRGLAQSIIDKMEGKT